MGGDRGGASLWLGPDAVESLVGADDDLTVSECWGGVGRFTEGVGGDDGKLVGRFDDATSASVVEEVEQASGADDRCVATGEAFSPDDRAGFGVKGVGESAIIGEE